MKIRNASLAGCRLSLRYAKDSFGNPEVVTGDENGVFDIPEKDAKFILATSGWSLAKKARALAAPEPVVVESPPEPEAPEEAPEEEAEEESEEASDEGVDLESMNRDELIALAEKYEVEVSSRWGDKRLRKVLEEEIFEEE
ncbi:hypothetical protein K0U83_15075 [bacterium]|nr:hypothetical protein [bacterium]